MAPYPGTLMPDCGVHYLWFAFVCFLIRSHPPYPGTPFWGGRGGGVGGVKTSLRIAAAVCGFRPRFSRLFFLYMDPLTHGGGPGSKLRVPAAPPPPIWPLTREDLVVFGPVWLFFGT